MKDKDTKLLEEAYIKINEESFDLIPAGEYPIYFSGFFGKSEYRGYKDTKKTIHVDEQKAEFYKDLPSKGLKLYIVKELESANERYKEKAYRMYNTAPGIYVIGV